MNDIVMNSQDALSGALGECYIDMPDDRRYKFMSATNIEAKMEKNKVELPILGKTGKGNKSTGWKGTGSATFYYNTSIFRTLLDEYKKTGKDIYFDMTIINNDTTATVGTQTIILKNCNTNGGILAKLDAAGEYLEEEMEFTFDDWELKSEFKPLDGMEA